MDSGVQQSPVKKNLLTVIAVRVKFRTSGGKKGLAKALIT